MPPTGKPAVSHVMHIGYFLQLQLDSRTRSAAGTVNEMIRAVRVIWARVTIFTCLVPYAVHPLPSLFVIMAGASSSTVRAQVPGTSAAAVIVKYRAHGHFFAPARVNTRTSISACLQPETYQVFISDLRVLWSD